MRIGFLVNQIQTELENYTTTRLGLAAVNRGHEVWVMGVGDLDYDPEGRVRARAATLPKQRYVTAASYVGDLQSKKQCKQRITVCDLDVLMLRNLPAEDYLARPWAVTVATEFARLAMNNGVIVLNDPNGLAQAASKMYFQMFPEEVRPRTLISRDREEIKHFARHEGTIVIKPL
jgi:glutathione synthase